MKWCEVCRLFGIAGKAVCVDHIIPHGRRNDRMFDEYNWQALCQECHNRKTKREAMVGRADWKVTSQVVIVAGASDEDMQHWVGGNAIAIEDVSEALAAAREARARLIDWGKQ